jgi:hypothetical protein
MNINEIIVQEANAMLVSGHCDEMSKSREWIRYSFRPNYEIKWVPNVGDMGFGGKKVISGPGIDKDFCMLLQDKLCDRGVLTQKVKLVKDSNYGDYITVQIERERGEIPMAPERLMKHIRYILDNPEELEKYFRLDRKQNSRLYKPGERVYPGGKGINKQKLLKQKMSYWFICSYKMPGSGMFLLLKDDTSVAAYASLLSYDEAQAILNKGE